MSLVILDLIFNVLPSSDKVLLMPWIGFGIKTYQVLFQHPHHCRQEFEVYQIGVQKSKLVSLEVTSSHDAASQRLSIHFLLWSQSRWQRKMECQLPKIIKCLGPKVLLLWGQLRSSRGVSWSFLLCGSGMKKLIISLLWQWHGGYSCESLLEGKAPPCTCKGKKSGKGIS